MSTQDGRPGQVAARQRRALGRYLRDEVSRYSPLNRARLDKVGGNGGKLTETLRLVDPVRLADVDAQAAVMRPSVDEVKQAGPVRQRGALVAESVFRGDAGVSARVDPVFKPIHWHVADGSLVGNTATDLHVLGELGRQILERAGVKPDDRVLNTLSAGPCRDYWQMVLGCQAGGVSAMHGWPPGASRSLADAGATVLIARPDDAADTLVADSHASLATVIAVGEMTQGQRENLERIAAPAAVVQAFAPPGVRTLWSENRGHRGLVPFPENELVEVVGENGREVVETSEGRLVWTPINWRGTVVVRLDTGRRARPRRTAGVVTLIELLPADDRAGHAQSDPDPEPSPQTVELDVAAQAPATATTEPAASETEPEPAVPAPAEPAARSRPKRNVPTRTVPARPLPTRKVAAPRPKRRPPADA